ncbi:hypothetical protein VTN77DRAFT_5182 [Rasamsonia byssochlamydoides]|uniref:uncharacterized protein n=1 Tax=Rasamsonia byssochlamydoides TaxID=89139 RepID=UPI003743E3E2
MAVNRNMFDASVSAEPHSGQGASILTLPLNLIAHIVSYIEEPADLARVCRTCRVLNYMSLPQLYRNLVLTSYDRIRYRDDQPEGWGGASPFSMGLSALVTRPHASLVHSMTLRGEWKEHELEEHASVGRVPDSSMMLNIALRAAIDRTTNLESFSWELNTKMLETVYIGLSQLPHLTSLSVRFPSSRHPRPTIVIPPMPHLRSLKVTDIDPLCYPDDISTLLAKSRNLRELKMHWSPRMREAQEPSVILHDYFRKCSKERPLKLKKIAMQNLYARNTEDWSEAIDQSSIEEVTFLSSPGFEDAASSTFVHNTWTSRPPAGQVNFKSIRHDSFNKKHCEFLTTFTGLERLYFVNPVHDQLNSPRQSVGPSSTTVTPPRVENTTNTAPTTAASAIAARAVSPASPHSPLNSVNQNILMRDTYFNTIVGNHGATLRHLLLPSRWPLSANLIARLVHACPNLEQLALAAEISALETSRLLLPFLRKLVAIRILIPQPAVSEKAASGQSTIFQANGGAFFSAPTIADVLELDDHIHNEMMGAALADKETFGKLKVVGLGWKGWELGEFYTIPAETAEAVDSGRDQSGERPNGPVANGNGVTDSQGSVTEAVASRKAKSPIVLPNGTPAAAPLPTKSSLGKRPREPSSPSPPFSIESQNNRDGLASDPTHGLDMTEVLPSGERVIWRRRVRRVGWEVLKHWEIWALDSQEI